MSTSAGHPQKTELGIDELRRRTRGLSQRHRTMLLLVNGHRTRREVLALASQAGVGAEYFDELVAIGMVDPAPTQPAPPATGFSEISPGALGAVSRPQPLAPEPAPPPGRPEPVPAPALAPASVLAPAPASTSTPAPFVPSLAAPYPVPLDTRPAALPPVPPKAVRAAPPPEPAAVAGARNEPRLDGRIERAIATALARGEPAAEQATAGPMPPTTPRPAAVVNAAGASGPPRPKRSAPPVPVLTLEDSVPMSATRAATEAAAPAKARVAAGAASARAPKSGPSGKPGALVPGAEPAGGARVKFSGTAQKPPKPPSRRHADETRREEPTLTPAKPPARPARIKMTAPAQPLDDEAESALLAEVRSLLIGTLLVDGPVTSSLTALRVRKARTRFDLTALVWEIERTLVRAKRPREGQSRLARARDLLGLGNTVVDEETSPDFPRTLPPSKT